MASIDDLKSMPTTGDDIVLSASNPIDEDEKQHTTKVKMGANGEKINIRPKTIIGGGNPTLKVNVTSNRPQQQVAHEETDTRRELDLNSLPMSEVDQEYASNTKTSPMEDINSMVDEYLDDKEEELKEAYAEVANNIAEKEAEDELDNGVSDDTSYSDDLDDLLSDDDNDSTSVVDDDGNDDFESLIKEDEDNEIIPVAKKGTAPISKAIPVSDGDEDIIEEDDPEKELAEEAEENDRDAYLKRLKDLATEKLKPAAKNLNLKSFTVIRKPTTNLNFLQQNSVAVAKWVLPNQESIVLMREYLGIELEELRRFSEDPTSPTSLTRKFRSIYDHIESPKPATFEAWLKSTPYSDMDHYFFGVFVASYQGTNYIPYDCKNTECKNTFLTDDINIMDMVKFKDDEAKAKFKKIYQSEESSSTKEGIYVSEIVTISDRIAVAFKEPTLYNVIENNSLDADFRRKYSNIVNLVPYIDNIYIIDIQSQQLIPIGYKIYENNATKTFKSKIQKYNAVFLTLSNDEFTLIQSYVSSVINRESFISYQYPEVECPECHQLVPATDTDAESAVFTRYQLGALVNTTLS